MRRAKKWQDMVIKLRELWNHILVISGVTQGQKYMVLAHCTSVALSSLLVIFSENLPLCLGLANTDGNSNIVDAIYSLQH